MEREDALKAEPTGWLMDWVWDVREKNGGWLLGFWQRDQTVPFADAGRPWARSRVWEGESGPQFRAWGVWCRLRSTRSVGGRGASPGWRYKVRSQNQMRLPRGLAQMKRPQGWAPGSSLSPQEEEELTKGTARQEHWAPEAKWRNCSRKERATSCVKCCWDPLKRWGKESARVRANTRTARDGWK